MKSFICLVILVLISGSVWATPSQQAEKLPADLTELSLEELMNIEVTSVSKKTQKLSEAAAAVFVITQEDIRRFGCTSIAEALRMVPGVQVSRIDANRYAISSRGFSGRFSRKLLVLIDGRSVYTPLYSGVFWEVQDVLLEDIARIEVIRGPGAALWGANAVNGVINIITNSARNTQGGLAAASAGTEERGLGVIRYGGELSDEAFYRVYAKYLNRDSFVSEMGEKGLDEWDVLRGGFRIDYDASPSNSLTIQGDIYDGSLGEIYRAVVSLQQPFARTFEEKADMTGTNVLARWQHIFSDASDLALQAYYDWTDHTYELVWESRNTFDIDLQHRLAIGKRHELIWGLGYRFTHDNIEGSFSVAFQPASRDDHLVSAFVQDDVTLVEDRLGLAFGSKFEHNDYTGFEIQPSARLLWTPHRFHTVWAAVSRAVRTPSRAEHNARLHQEVLPPDVLYPGAPTTLITFMGSPNAESEELLAYEFGYRVQPSSRISLDLAAFYNIYDRLITIEPGTPFLETLPSPPHLIVPMVVSNKMQGETYGIELATDYRILSGWRLRAAYTYLQMLLELNEDSADGVSEQEEGKNPRHEFSLRSSTDLPWNVEMDLAFRYVDELPLIDVDSYFTLDARLGWNLGEHLEMYVVGQNLLDSHHLEFISEFVQTLPVEVERGVYSGIRWRF